MTEIIKNTELENKETQEQEVKTFTQEEVDKLIQAETDRKTTKALQTAKEKWEEEYKAKLETEKSEAEKLASMSAEERAKAEFESQRAEWEKEKAEFEKGKLKLEATKELSSEGLPVEFVDYVLADTAEQTQANIKMFKETWSKALDQMVSERLKGKTPSVGSTLPETSKLTKEEFGKLSYKERQSMLNVDPDLLKKLK